MTRPCPACGAPPTEGVKFCPACGTSIAGSPDPVIQRNPSPPRTGWIVAAVIGGIAALIGTCVAVGGGGDGPSEVYEICERTYRESYGGDPTTNEALEAIGLCMEAIDQDGDGTPDNP